MNLSYDRNIKLLDTLESREKLRSILSDPVFLAAMAVVAEDCRVAKADLDKQIDAVLTRRTAYHSGVADVTDLLRTLTRKDNSGGLREDEEEPFDYLTPETP
tara:strand:- start:68 stop:373 length:306 start_codon:yes stop_codon:yes gene_type:complete